MKDWLGRFGRARGGIAAVEFAIVSPLLLFLCLSGLILGEYLTVAHSVQQLANEAARYSVAAGDSTAERRVLVGDFIARHAATYPLIDPDLLSATVTPEPDNFHRVTVRYETQQLLLSLFDRIGTFHPLAIERAAVVRAGGF